MASGNAFVLLVATLVGSAFGLLLTTKHALVSFLVVASVRPVIGIDDLLILCAIYFALITLGYRGLLVFGAPLAGLVAARVVGLTVGGIFGIPFLAASTMAYVTLRPTPRAREQE